MALQTNKNQSMKPISLDLFLYTYRMIINEFPQIETTILKMLVFIKQHYRCDVQAQKRKPRIHFPKQNTIICVLSIIRSSSIKNVSGQNGRNHQFFIFFSIKEARFYCYWSHIYIFKRIYRYRAHISILLHINHHTTNTSIVHYLHTMWHLKIK